MRLHAVGDARALGLHAGRRSTPCSFAKVSAERSKAAERALQNWSGTSFEDARESVSTPPVGAAAAGPSSGQCLPNPSDLTRPPS